jgi:proton-dependent oligopeptide transporter, POT family
MAQPKILSGFSPNFWIANTLEIFERLAFYGSKAVLLVFLLDYVGVKEAATLIGIFSGVIYFLPVVAGVFVDKYGFRKTLMACFFIFCIGYFLIGLAGMEFGKEILEAVGKNTYVISVLLLTAIGGSLIKPCIVGTVAKTSKPEVKSLGFSIYYTLVNLGGAIGPVIALYVREGRGIEFVLIMSSVTSFLLLIGTFLFFGEPKSDGVEVVDVRTFGKVFGDMALVFGNLRFMLFLIIFGGFWTMFWHVFYLLPKYGTDVLNFERFELLETVDAACIIFLTVPMAALVKSWKPLTAMTLGFIISSFSWIVIGAFQTVTAAVIGVGLFALGEAIQTPRFYEYVSNLAPKNQVGTYMGFAFLPVSIGSFAAGPIADWLRITYIETNPAMMWYIVSGIGFACTVLMLLYNAFLAPKTSEA